jgi:hypothetical protein
VDLRAFVDPESTRAWRGLFSHPGQASLLGWRDPRGRRDLLILAAHGAPTRRLWDYCEEIASIANEFGVRRAITLSTVVTALASPTQTRVRGAATSPELLSELRRAGVDPLDARSVPGMGGLVPTVLSGQGVESACLAGELPPVAAELPTSVPVHAVLARLAALAEIDLDLSELVERCKRAFLLTTLRDPLGVAMPFQISFRVTPQDEPDTKQDPVEPEPDFEDPLREFNADAFNADELQEPSGSTLSPEALARIRYLFRASREDRRQAFALKDELDRHGVFQEFEDRFLDLFRNPE